MRRAAVPLLLTMLAGCASGVPSEHWAFEKAGATQAQMKRDRTDCFSEAIDAMNLDRGGLIRLDRHAYRSCMEQRGYAVRVTPD